MTGILNRYENPVELLSVHFFSGHEENIVTIGKQHIHLLNCCEDQKGLSLAAVLKIPICNCLQCSHSLSHIRFRFVNFILAKYDYDTIIKVYSVLSAL